MPLVYCSCPILVERGWTGHDCSHCPIPLCRGARFYYTFGSLVAVQIIFELGFSFVILQLASHERASLSIARQW